MKSKTLDIIGFYSLTGSAAYKVAAVKSFPLGQLIVPFQKNIFFSFFIQPASACIVSLEMMFVHSFTEEERKVVQGAPVHSVRFMA